jgi:hypothetical protein
MVSIMQTSGASMAIFSRALIPPMMGGPYNRMKLMETREKTLDAVILILTLHVAACEILNVSLLIV